MARFLGLGLLLTLCACNRERIEPVRAAQHAPLRVVAPVAWLPLQPADAAGAASAGEVALARLGPRTLAFVADADDGAVVTFDVEAHRPLTSTPIGARPSAVLVTTTGRVVVLGADDARVHIMGMAQV